MDGTLLDSQRPAIYAWDYAGELQGIENAGSHIPNVCGMNETGWSNYLIKTFENLDLEKFIRDKEEYFAKIDINKPKKGMFELLDYLKTTDIKLAIASGSNTEIVINNFTELNALDYFDAFVGGEKVNNGKPAPDIFLYAARELGVKPEECIVFEDSANGILAAVNAGMKTIGIPDVVQFDDATNAVLLHELNSLDEAIDIIKEIRGQK